MERDERERLERLLPRDAELRRLWDEHQLLERELERLGAQRFLTPDERLQRKELKKRKLAGRDSIQAILSRHR